MAPLPTKLQAVLTRLRERFSVRAEDAYRARATADASGRQNAASYAAGQAQAHGRDEESVRDAQDEAEK